MTVATDRLRALPLALGNLAWRPMVIGFAATLILLPAIAVGGALAFASTYDGRALPNVSVAGVEVSGLERAEAEAAVREALPSLSAGELTLVAGDEERTIEYAAFGRDYELDAMLDAAFSAGHAGNPVERAVTFARTAVHGTSVNATATYDSAALERLVAAAAADMVKEPQDAAVTLSEGSGFEVTPAVSGRRVDVATAHAQIAAAIGSLDPSDATVQLTARPVEPALTTAEAEAAAETANGMTAHDLTLTAGADEFTVAAEKLRAWVDVAATASGSFDVTLVTDRITPEVEALVESVDRPAQDAGYGINGGEITVTPSVEGRALDVEKTVAKVHETLSAQRPGDPAPSVELAVAITAPALTTEQAQAAVPKMEVISSWTTYFTPNPGDFFGENIAVPTRILDGYVVAPGAWFEFWSAVGPVTPERGYGPGGAIINGRSVPTGAMGGGICSTSTTLFNAALRAGLEIGDRTNHYYYIPRYPTGLDATVAIADGAVTTMSFRNDTAYPIVIRGYYEYGVVRFDIVGVPTGRVVSFSEPRIANEKAAKDVIEYTDELEPGEQERVEYPHDGMEVWVTRTVTDANGALVHQEEYYSNYGVVNGIIREGRAEEDADASASPSPSASPAP